MSITVERNWDSDIVIDLIGVCPHQLGFGQTEDCALDPVIRIVSARYDGMETLATERQKVRVRDLDQVAAKTHKRVGFACNALSECLDLHLWQLKRAVGKEVFHLSPLA